jgi:uncharacterized membrane protein YhhN
MNLSLVLSIAVIAVSAAFAVYGKYKKQRFVYYAFKPLTMVLVVSLAWERTLSFPSAYGYFILSGLCFSLLGDIMVMFPRKFLRYGLLAFMAGYLFYILAFRRDVEIVSYAALIPILGFAAIFYFYLYKGLSKMRWPVLVYTLIVSIMAWLGVNKYLDLRDTKSFLVFIGCILLLISESVWAVNRFRKAFWLAEILILGTYFPAQLLFSLSI